jgi:hypothetical protein
MVVQASNQQQAEGIMSTKQKIFTWGGVAAGIILIGFGAGALILSVQGHNTVNSSLKEQQIVGTPDMTPAQIKSEAKGAGLPASITLPTCSVAGQPVTNGVRARCFADYMRIHTYLATGGVPYSQMPRYATADGKGTNDPQKALTKGGQPVDNAARNIWVTETALSTALNVSYMAEQLARFGVVVGIALVLSGIGFVILAVGGALRAGSWLLGEDSSSKTAAKVTRSVTA